MVLERLVSQRPRWDLMDVFEVLRLGCQYVFWFEMFLRHLHGTDSPDLCIAPG